MKKSILFLALAAGLLLAVSTSSLLAVDAAGKEVTVTGSMVCGKCKLHEAKSCQSVIQVEKDGQTVNYYLAQNDTAKGCHKDICGGNAEKVTATGTVEEKDGKQILTASKIEAVK
jgi:hypothetical protein